MKPVKIFCMVVVSIYLFPAVLWAGSKQAGGDFSDAEKLFLEGNYEQAVSKLNGMISNGAKPVDSIYYLKGLCELKNNKFSDARSSFGAALSNTSNRKIAFDASLGTGDSYFLEGNTSKAITVYDKIVSDYPKDKNMAVVYHRLGSCYKKLDQPEKANGYFAKLKQGAPLGFEAKNSAYLPQNKAVAPKPTGILPSGAKPEPELILDTDKPGVISVQVGGFKKRLNAERCAAKLVSEGYDSYVVPPSASGDRLYRVKVGRYNSKAEAEKTAAILVKKGYSVQICDGMVCKKR